MAAEGKGPVFLALIGNAVLTVIKFVAFAVSGSGAMFSEAVHSLADTCNQGLLYWGIERSKKPADTRYQYGYGIERYLFALLSAVGIFVLGCGFTVYHGIEGILHPPTLQLSWIVFAVLGVSLVMDGVVFMSALREVNRRRGTQSMMEFVRSSTDPTLLAVLFEDFVAVAGVLVAFLGIGLAHLTGNAVFDGVSSILIGLLLGAIAIWLGARNRQLILGPAIPRQMEDDVIAFLQAQPSVEAVRLVRTRIAAADRFTLAAEIDYDGAYLARAHVGLVAERADGLSEAGAREQFAAEFGECMMDTLAREVDRIEAELFARFPRLRHVALESDAGTGSLVDRPS